MARIQSAIIACVLSTLVLVGANTAIAGASRPIAPNQHFVGRVNGAHHETIVYTVCPGPTWLGRSGPVAGGQTMSVRKKATGNGYTGLFGQVYAWFVPTTTGTAPTQLSFKTYTTPQSIPTSVRVPCDGTGQVEFSSCPYLAPCAYGWVPDYVNVRFVNIAD